MDEKHAGWLLREVARLYSQLQRSEVANRCETSSTQCHALTELDRSGPLTFASLVRRLNTDKGFVSRTVEAMAQGGLLTKEPHPADKRTVIIALTPAGAAKASAVGSTLNDQSSRLVRRIPAAERDNVYRALELLHQALQAENAGEPILTKLEDDL